MITDPMIETRGLRWKRLSKQINEKRIKLFILFSFVVIVNNSNLCKFD